MGYGAIVLKSKSKSHLFKLLEFNKIEILKNNQFLRSNSDLEIMATKFM
jgi:hypothetical protein